MGRRPVVWWSDLIGQDGHAWKPYIQILDTKITNSYFIENYINLMLDLGQIVAIVKWPSSATNWQKTTIPWATFILVIL